MSTTTLNLEAIKAHRDTAARLCATIVGATLSENGFTCVSAHPWGQGCGAWMKYARGSVANNLFVDIYTPHLEDGIDEVVRAYCLVTIKQFSENGHPECYIDSKETRYVPLSHLVGFLERQGVIYKKRA